MDVNAVFIGQHVINYVNQKQRVNLVLVLWKILTRPYWLNSCGVYTNIRIMHPLKAKRHTLHHSEGIVFSTRDLLIRDSRMRLGLGENISVWNDPWIPDEYFCLE